MNALEPFTIIVKPTAKARAAEKLLRAAIAERKLKPKVPVVISVGGDGTMLLAIKQFIGQSVVFAGISAGSLGFLQTVEPKDCAKLVDALATGAYNLISAPLLEAVEVDKSGKTTHLGYGFSEISVERSGPRAVHISLDISGSAGTFIGDGVIFATPLGSTAYSLSAGGPIIDSESENVFVVTPNNPHVSILYSSLQRPHVLARDRQIQIGIAKADAADRPAQLLIDGETILERIERPITVRASSKSIKLLTLSKNTFANRIEQKRLGRY